MTRSPFEIAFDHYDDCEHCDYASRRLCPTGRVLFDAALEACKMIVGDEVPTAKASA
jgi:hypothetical protein